MKSIGLINKGLFGIKLATLSVVNVTLALSSIIFFSPREMDEVEKEDEAREERKCPLFRRRESLSIGKGIGYCDIASCSTTCEGDLSFCESPDFLKQYLRKR